MPSFAFGEPKTSALAEPPSFDALLAAEWQQASAAVALAREEAARKAAVPPPIVPAPHPPREARFLYD